MNTKNRRSLRVVFLVVFLVSMACSIGGTPSEEVVATLTPGASRTPAPSHTPGPPTITPALPTLRPSSTPIPTFTPVPSLTPVPKTPTVSPTPGVIGMGRPDEPLRDDFSDPLSGWPTRTDEDWGYGYADGGYVVYNNLAGADVCVSRTRIFADAVVGVTVTKLDGVDSAFYGVTCRKTIDDYYIVGINGNGEYAIIRGISEVSEIVYRGYSGAIRVSNASNQIEATCEGNTIMLVVNGTQVFYYEEAGLFAGNYVGVVLSTQHEAGVEVRFDNFYAHMP